MESIDRYTIGETHFFVNNSVTQLRTASLLTSEKVHMKCVLYQCHTRECFFLNIRFGMLKWRAYQTVAFSHNGNLCYLLTLLNEPLRAYCGIGFLHLVRFSFFVKLRHPKDPHRPFRLPLCLKRLLNPFELLLPRVYRRRYPF